MVHTLPPWTSKYRLVKIFANVDVAELVVRLGSPVSFDRRGNVVLIDDFAASVIKWSYPGYGTGNGHELSTAWAKSGSQSLKLFYKK